MSVWKKPDRPRRVSDKGRLGGRNTEPEEGIPQGKAAALKTESDGCRQALLYLEISCVSSFKIVINCFIQIFKEGKEVKVAGPCHTGHVALEAEKV